MLIESPNLNLPSTDFPSDRKVVTVTEVAARWEVSSRHVIDLIEEGKLAAFDIAGRQDYIRMPKAAITTMAKRFNCPETFILKIIAESKPRLVTSRRAFYRIPIVEGFQAFMHENHSLNLKQNHYAT